MNEHIERSLTGRETGRTHQKTPERKKRKPPKSCAIKIKTNAEKAKMKYMCRLMHTHKQQYFFLQFLSLMYFAMPSIVGSENKGSFRVSGPCSRKTNERKRKLRNDNLGDENVGMWRKKMEEKLQNGTRKKGR